MFEGPETLPGPGQSLTEGEAKRVLARAAELDSVREARITVIELTKVAQEAGISSESIRQALLELWQPASPDTDSLPRLYIDPDEETNVLRATRVRSRWRAWLPLTAAGIVIGGAVGYLRGLSVSDVQIETVLVFPFIAVLSIALAVLHRWRGSTRAFEEDLGVLWTGFGAGIMAYLVGTPLAEDAFFQILTWWLAAAVLGASVTMRRAAVEPSEQLEA